ncbi:MAG: ABC transporter permease subunit [Vampirovibrio sp.]|nr:ABC transporter permease subunit [Vampirovibrio sp.]
MNDFDWIAFVSERFPELIQRLNEHLLLTGVSTGLAVVIGLPIGLLAFRYLWLRSTIMGLVGMLQTIPSLAMLVMLLALFQKIGTLPALISLTLYALLPIVRNTLTGLQGVAPAVMEAARGLGMNRFQQLWMVRLPLAMPVILAGIRTAAVVGVGIATLAAFIGAGGLGQFINRGLSLSNTPLILLGAIPAALLALLVDFAIGWLGKILDSTQTPASQRKTVGVVAGVLALLVAGLAVFNSVSQAGNTQGVIRIGSKQFSEQLILGEMMAQLIEANTDLRVEKKFNLGGTLITHGALINREIDLYPEYTGTALSVMLKMDPITDSEESFRVVRQGYQEKFNVVWLDSLGFNNTYALAVRQADAKKNGWSNISDLAVPASQLSVGLPAEFTEREDGYPNFKKTYFDFGEERDLFSALMYEAVAKSQVDAIFAYSTDGRIKANNLLLLKDDKGFFPVYTCAPVIRQQVLDEHPELTGILTSLAGALDEDTMMALNYDVDLNQRSPAVVAKEFLEKKGLLP